jgi:septum site-determining protein MinC
MTETRPFIRMRGRTIMALVLTPEPPLPNWLASLDAQIERAPNFFDGRPVIVDVGTLPSETPDVASLMHAIVGRFIHIIGVEGAHPTWRGLEAWGRPLPGAGKPGKPIEIPQQPAQPAPAPRAAAPAAQTQAARAPIPSAPNAEPASLLIDHSVRSGQSIAFETGDITILGSVASGAEVVAGGSIHVYGALRGRAIAGLAGNAKARIYCRKLHAELVAIDGVYQTADDMPRERIGAPSCAWLDGDLMRITPID